MTLVRSLAAKQLKDWRVGRGMSQTEAAKHFEVSQASYSEYETGRKTPRTVKAVEIEGKSGGAVELSAWAKEAPPDEAQAQEPAATAPTGTGN